MFTQVVPPKYLGRRCHLNVWAGGTGACHRKLAGWWFTFESKLGVIML